MAKIERSALVPFSSAQMFALVNDIESYPEFMPGCVGAHVLDQGEGWIEARLDLARMGLKHSFTTRNTLQKPNSMRLSLVEGPFKSMRGEWRFEGLDGDEACKVIFWLEFSVKNPLLSLALSKFMEQIASDQVDAVCMRARSIYS